MILPLTSNVLSVLMLDKMVQTESVTRDPNKFKLCKCGSLVKFPKLASPNGEEDSNERCFRDEILPIYFNPKSSTSVYDTSKRSKHGSCPRTSMVVFPASVSWH
jgi:hypothetical protein